MREIIPSPNGNGNPALGRNDKGAEIGSSDRMAYKPDFQRDCILRVFTRIN